MILTVGYMDFDEDGGALNGVSDYIEYEYQDILDELDSFIDAQNCLADVTMKSILLDKKTGTYMSRSTSTRYKKRGLTELAIHLVPMQDAL